MGCHRTVSTVFGYRLWRALLLLLNSDNDVGVSDAGFPEAAAARELSYDTLINNNKTQTLIRSTLLISEPRLNGVFESISSGFSKQLPT